VPSTRADAICCFRRSGFQFYGSAPCEAAGGKAVQEIGAAVLVHGFDIPLLTPQLSKRFRASGGRMRHYDIPLIPVVTNWRDNDIDC